MFNFYFTNVWLLFSQSIWLIMRKLFYIYKVYILYKINHYLQFIKTKLHIPDHTSSPPQYNRFQIKSQSLLFNIKLRPSLLFHKQPPLFQRYRSSTFYDFVGEYSIICLKVEVIFLIFWNFLFQKVLWCSSDCWSDFFFFW